MTKRHGARRALVTGAGGFIGHHLVKRLKADGFWVRGVDLKRPEFEPSPADEFVTADLRSLDNCTHAVLGVQDVYQLAADMGGIGYIAKFHSQLARNNTLINAHMLEASRLEGIERYLYTSSACVYPSFLQDRENVSPLREQDAIPANPEMGYGWEKLFAEQLTAYYHQDDNLDVRIVRFHNVYGPLGTYEGGREKAPAAICRKVAEAEDGTSIEVWGDGRQTRTFCFIDDCVEGMRRIMESGYNDPINLGTDEVVTADGLVDLVCSIAGKHLEKVHNLDQPQGVRGRSCDTTRFRELLGWEPRVPLVEGLRETYAWVWAELARRGRAKPPMPRVPVEHSPSLPVAQSLLGPEAGSSAEGALRADLHLGWGFVGEDQPEDGRENPPDSL
ncbi:MAG TPA: NAD-dependent epimerase/dehydratase family protein [Thermoplasmata archaeon]|nr:NAD-dependent epimerase/dehydratase family protein [Thermoplasmata archaeon]